MRVFWSGAAWFAIVALCTGAACNQSPTGPTPTPTSTPVPIVVSIAAVNPAQPTRNSGAQTLRVEGAGFQAGLVLMFTAPSGATLTVGGADIQRLMTTSFDAAVTLSEVGTYVFLIRQVTGDTSNPFPFSVQDAVLTDPAIDNISPTFPALGSQPQVVTLIGRNFVPAQRVHVAAPDGVVVESDAPHLGAETPTRIQFTMVFNKLGSYTVSLWTPLGPTSNFVTVIVR